MPAPFLVPYPPPPMDTSSADGAKVTSRDAKSNFWREKVALALRFILERLQSLEGVTLTSGASPRFLGLPCETTKVPLGSTRLMAYHSASRRLFVSQNDGGSHFAIYERYGNRWKFLSDPSIPTAGNDNVTLLLYVPATERIWFSDENSEEIYELDADGNVTNTFSMAGCLKMRSGDMAYLDVFPAEATDPYVFLFNDGAEIYQLDTAGNVVANTTGLDCKQLCMRRNFGNRFSRGYFVRATGDVSRIETDLTVSDPAGLVQATTGIPAASEYCCNYNDLWDRLTVIPDGTGDVFLLDVSDGADVFECQAALSVTINSNENAPFNYTIGRLLLTSDSHYVEMGYPSVITGWEEAGKCTWTLVAGSAPKNIVLLEHDNGLPEQFIREAVVSDGAYFHVVR